MVKNKIKYAGIILLVLILLAGITTFIFRDKIKTRFMPEVKQSGKIEVVVENDTSYLKTKLVIKNKFLFHINIDTVKYKVSMFDKEYIKSEKFVDLSLPGYTSDSLNILIKVPYKVILKDLKAARQKEDSAGYTINVSIQYSTILKKSEMPIARSGKLKIPQPPELIVEGIKWKKVRMKSLFADVKIKIINHSPIALFIKNMNYHMDIADQGTLKGSYDKPVDIIPNETTFFNIPITIKPKNIGKTVLQVLFDKDKYDYTLTLKAVLESVEPEKKIFNLNLIKTGKMELKK
jgi:LEA14-like dessication related protein